MNNSIIVNSTYVHAQYNLSADLNRGATLDVIIREARIQELLQFKRIYGSVFISQLQENSLVLTETFTVHNT